MSQKKTKFYAVLRGRKTGIFREWDSDEGAKAQIHGFPGAIYKSFPSLDGALDWVSRMGDGDPRWCRGQDIYLYVLELEGGHYYVGQSIEPIHRIQQHFRDKGSAWCSVHRPVGVIEIRATGESDWKFVEKQETDLTVSFMRKYGWQYVRGGVFSNVSPEETRKALLSHGVNDVLYAAKVGFKSASSDIKISSSEATPKAEQTGGKVDHEFPNNGKKWESHDEKRLLATWDSGVTLEDLSPRFGRTAGALCAKLANLGNHGDRESIRAENVRRGRVYGSMSQGFKERLHD